MTDILDEILAATESVRSQLHQLPTPSPTPKANPHANLTVSVAPAPPLQFLSSSYASISPRGVQDDIHPFDLIQSTPPRYFNKPSPQPHQDDDDAAAAAVAAAISSVVAPPQPDHPRPPIAESSAQPSRPSPAATTASTTSPSQPQPVQHPQTRIRSVDSTADLQQLHPSLEPSKQWGLPSAVASNKRPYSHVDDPPSKPFPAATSSADPEAKRSKLEPNVVMPPSAKSILERREKAIREGRRKDAKLTEAERRILRRLRNRESAERCRLRRMHQAEELEKKIKSMQVENDRLVAMAEEYEKTIHRLESVIENFSSQRNL